MRLVVGVLACLSVGAISPALADPTADSAVTQTSPAPAAATPAVAAPAAAPAPAAQPAAASAPSADHATVEVDAAQMDRLEKHFLSEGYKVEMHNGEKLFCRREEQSGSRLGGKKQCSTAQQLEFTENDSRRQVERAQHNQASSPH